MELLAHEIQSAIDAFSDANIMVAPDKSKLARSVGARVADVNRRFGPESEFAQYHSNLLNSYMPDGFANIHDIGEASEGFESLWKEFGL